jgi:hypothetical protein
MAELERMRGRKDGLELADTNETNETERVSVRAGAKGV